MSDRAFTVTAIGLLALLALGALVLYARSDRFALMQADWYGQDGRCFWCGHPLEDGQLLGAYNEHPEYGLLHAACIEAADCPPWEIGL